MTVVMKEMKVGQVIEGYFSGTPVADVVELQTPEGPVRAQIGKELCVAIWERNRRALFGPSEGRVGLMTRITRIGSRGFSYCQYRVETDDGT